MTRLQEKGPTAMGTAIDGISSAPQDDGFDWYSSFRGRHGRPLRVLHVGNIANNAFNNARIQRQHGIDAYVLAYENYHIMACPEWEEANFDGDLGDPFFPNWSSLDLKGYLRPGWFASGPLELCCAMIEAEVTGQEVLAEQLRHSLDRARRRVSSQTAYARAVRYGQRAKRFARRSALGALRAFSGGDQKVELARLAVISEQAPVQLSPLRESDLASYRARLAPLIRLFDHFDVIQAYSTDGAWPLLAHHPYLAYEHGTLRAIPFQDDSLGRLARTVFLGAQHVLVTNIDCLSAARRLGIPSSRITPLPHAFDDKKLVEFKKANPAIRPPDDRILFFHPARHDWLDADPSLVKGNDRLIRAFATVAREDSRLRLAMIAWGRDLQASRELVRSLGLEGRVQWMDPMRKPQLWQAYLSSHAVLDQFVLPSFGGITFEALALGRPVITHIDSGSAAEFFSQSPPVLQASSDNEIAVALRRIASDPGDMQQLGEAGATWIQRLHSAKRIVELQLRAYRQYLAGSQPIEPSTSREEL
ncbi:glycosyltransferase family 4 protein [Bradyrhizobium sp. CCBAU 51627]|uniref:glycosyltransferase family 4 protein n=1 Tax=Bradyrhizobium sp. CCBAU 51627 TaxID=1325088 RepID=UPI002304EFB5|nr:glycosyltransferase family 4 protein [Bradyrhizobium sp. CCBAU 51627]MDA9430547.1 hypothetical protein [Bradyrhizobium sp. CCBAU 51627]